jgi:hypothetical protein
MPQFQRQCNVTRVEVYVAKLRARRMSTVHVRRNRRAGYGRTRHVGDIGAVK